jgi:hypothetical protein
MKVVTGTTLLAACLLLVFLLGFFFDTENGGDIFLRNIA